MLFRSNDTATTEIYTVPYTLSLHDALPISDARALLLRHRLRAGDAVQLASCLYLQREMNQPLPFVAFDDRLAEAARHEGLTVVPVSKDRR